MTIDEILEKYPSDSKAYFKRKGAGIFDWKYSMQTLRDLKTARDAGTLIFPSLIKDAKANDWQEVA